ncbi:beta-fructofuranosidase [Bacillus sp. OV166]|uniref:glycoside hydrolase family 32 protein n=1 Tax=unclassified Bacillus (in: firmicutes) TaxID=185979 RepID=UPI000A2AE6A8|nr:MULTISPECIES: sucrose-6-phosphate hydrolase [unclassified Bacillus (in: firmicutes)]PGY08360.1 sucrose-6-phosphate hydrolase [Bacillus sp. AFS031507]SMQ77415.1 beta-fructofuranosidase [Bacillus sp. OV166]
MEWTKEKRYRRIEDESPEAMQELMKKVNACPWRQSFHIQPNTGLLNDPNGFAFYNGYYHLFYQWFPLGPVHGLKYWYHVKSKDLVHWEDEGIGIAPGDFFDSHGAYSGSAIEQDGNLFLLYTGNTRDVNWQRHPYQCLAVMNEQGDIEKENLPVISTVPSGYTDHFRDPKVWKSEDGQYYTVIGAQRDNLTGTAVLYRSSNLKQWNFEGELATELENFGYMWECPDYFELAHQGIFVFSPQGLEPHGDDFHNIYQSGYILGKKLDLPNRNFGHGDFRELDRGFDFYAPQTTLGPDGRRILIGWMGLPEIEYPTDPNGWAHCLTIPRELKVKNDKLIQQPIEEMKLLRKVEQKITDFIENDVKSFPGMNGTTFELYCEMSDIFAEECGIEFRANDTKKTVIKYHLAEQKVILDRSYSGEEVGISYGTKRACHLNSNKISIHMFVDTSSVEIFINDGEEVFTARIFPESDCDQIRFFASKGSVMFNIKKWDLKKK